MRVLSLILCSRNDQYMGNSRWRLETTLNYVAQRVHELAREREVEVLVVDWGSEIPLSEVLRLSPAAAKIVSFLPVPAQLARDLQKDSPFPEVLALNAAARRASGEFIGRIDQDTLVGNRFLETFFELYEGRQQIEVPLASALLFSNVRMVPYRFSARCPSLGLVDQFISRFGSHLKIEVSSRRPFYAFGVGIWLLHRTLWNECGGYDERMIYMNDMEINMVTRLHQRYQIVNLGKLVNYDFYHLEHYHPWQSRKSSAHRQVNSDRAFSDPVALNPNGDSWGLRQFPLQTFSARNTGEVVTRVALGRFERLSFFLMMRHVSSLMFCDKVFLSVRARCRPWMHRAKVAWHTVYGKPLRSWPGLIRKRWIEKKLAQMSQSSKAGPFHSC